MGKIIIEPIYDDIYFQTPIVLLKKDKKYGYYNLDNKTTSDCKYDGIKSIDYGNLRSSWLFFENGNKTEVKKY